MIYNAFYFKNGQRHEVIAESLPEFLRELDRLAKKKGVQLTGVHMKFHVKTAVA